MHTTRVTPAFSQPLIDRAYDYCMTRARRHYENFPVASFLLPSHLRPSVAAIYCVARHGDDLVDEGNDPPEFRQQKLASYADLVRQASGTDFHLDGPEEIALPLLAYGDTLRRFSIPPSLMMDLFSAFEQDTRQREYETWEDLLDYCNRSANPVGRMLLALFDCLDEKHAAPADALCTALQLTNFWQDVGRDAEKGRCYIPLNHLRSFNVHLTDLHATKASPELRSAILFEVEQTESVFCLSEDLFSMVPRRLRMELTAILKGGREVLRKICKVQGDVLAQRPELSTLDLARIMISALFA